MNLIGGGVTGTCVRLSPLQCDEGVVGCGEGGTISASGRSEMMRGCILCCILTSRLQTHQMLNSSRRFRYK